MASVRCRLRLLSVEVDVVVPLRRCWLPGAVIAATRNPASAASNQGSANHE